MYVYILYYVYAYVYNVYIYISMCPHAEAGTVYASQASQATIYVSSYYMCPNTEASAVRITRLCICIYNI
jgi:hypothetical protein